MKTLQPGDIVFYHAADGRRFRGRVADYLPMRSRGEEMWIPVCKRSGRIAHLFPRSALRKAPARRDVFPCPIESSQNSGSMTHT